MNFLKLLFVALLVTYSSAFEDIQDISRRFILDSLSHLDIDLDKVPDDLKILECKLCKCEKRCHADFFHLHESDVCDEFMKSISCSDPTDFCVSSPCRNGAACSNTQSTYVCQCKPGWTGVTCDSALTTSTCTQATCIHGHCTENNGIHSCMCDNGWKGDQCQTDVNECVNNPCQNGGKCSNTDGNYSCSCTSGWTGSRCEQALHTSACTLATCIHGQCTETNGIHSCTCNKGWKGNQCQTEVNECDNHPCQNGGKCSNTIGDYSCSCTSGWAGNRCEQDIDECTRNPCSNQTATCLNTVGSYDCQCSNGWTGNTCDTDIDECAMYHFCLNGAKCINTPGHFICSCASGWNGTQCQLDVDECTNNPCKHGSCTNTRGSYSCVCSAGWTGPDCEIEINLCASNPCKNGATCNRGSNTYTCQCAPGHIGTNCDIDDVCVSNNPCQNGATCITDQTGQYTCQCASGWSGQHCEKGHPGECDHICTLESVVKQIPVSAQGAASCPGPSIFASNEALPRQCCQLGEQATWKKGQQVMSQCKSGTIKPYTPVAAYKNGMIEPGAAGVFTACLQVESGFVMIRQGCTSTPHVYHVNGTSTGNVDSDPDNYFVLS